MKTKVFIFNKLFLLKILLSVATIDMLLPCNNNNPTNVHSVLRYFIFFIYLMHFVTCLTAKDSGILEKH